MSLLTPSESWRKPPAQVVVRDLVDRAKTYVIDIDDHGAIVRDSNEPVDERQILGCGCWMSASTGKTFVAYFASNRVSSHTAPEYEQQLWLLLDGMIIDLSRREVSLLVKQSFSDRTVTIEQSGRLMAAFTYKRPVYRGWINKVFGDPFLGEGDVVDVVSELSGLARKAPWPGQEDE